MSVMSVLHPQLMNKGPMLCEWYCQKLSGIGFPIYSSFDIRDSGFKIAPVDGNIYPAGFNNICPTDKESSVDILKTYLDKHYGSQIERILLVTEEHTQNPYYWDNISTLTRLLEDGGRRVLVAFPRKLDQKIDLMSASGYQISVVSGDLESSPVKDFKPQLILSNNDFTHDYSEWAVQVQMYQLPINPPRELGWYQRKKSRFFDHYNALATEFAGLVGIDESILRVETKLFPQFDINSQESRVKLSQEVEKFIHDLRLKYKTLGWTAEPFVFVKNNSGTYGLGVMKVSNPEEILKWSYKDRKKMKAAKGGRDIEELIIQEGIPSVVESGGAAAEPVIYMIGKELAGGFLRTHHEKDSTESLNSPGAVYKRLCVSDLLVDAKPCMLENVYGWVAKLGLLAMALEGKAMNLEYHAFRTQSELDGRGSGSHRAACLPQEL